MNHNLVWRTQSLLRGLAKPGFNLQMAYASIAFLLVSIVGCWLTSIYVPDTGRALFGCLVLFAIVLPLPLYLMEKGKLYLRDSVLTILWAVLLYGILHIPVVVAARAGMGIGLQDSLFARGDQLLGVSVPGIMAWAAHHWLGNLSSMSYGLLIPLLQVSILLPILAGKLRDAQRFITANLVAFAVGLPLFALLPAVGPWYSLHFAPDAGQADCQAAFLLARQPGLYIYQSAGFVCFPSFHVIWAILCAYALWDLRLLRLPVAVLTGLIIFSTLTTGWHYFCDVLGGVLVAALAIGAANWLNRCATRCDPAHAAQPHALQVSSPAHAKEPQPLTDCGSLSVQRRG